jgi:hypothetical protein
LIWWYSFDPPVDEAQPNAISWGRPLDAFNQLLGTPVGFVGRAPVIEIHVVPGAPPLRGSTANIHDPAGTVTPDADATTGDADGLRATSSGTPMLVERVAVPFESSVYPLARLL